MPRRSPLTQPLFSEAETASEKTTPYQDDCITGICPICGADRVLVNKSLVCPNGHGRLLPINQTAINHFLAANRSRRKQAKK
jgi:hypothetical protein